VKGVKAAEYENDHTNMFLLPWTNEVTHFLHHLNFSAKLVLAIQKGEFG
jgi:hypothetical protein